MSTPSYGDGPIPWPDLSVNRSICHWDICGKLHKTLRSMRVPNLPLIRPSRYGRENRKCWSQKVLAGMGKRGFPALPCERYFLAENKGHDGDIWAKIKLFLTYCLYIRPIFKERLRKYCFPPIDSNAEAGPALRFAICHENAYAMHKFTEISRPAYSV